MSTADSDSRHAQDHSRPERDLEKTQTDSTAEPTPQQYLERTNTDASATGGRDEALKRYPEYRPVYASRLFWDGDSQGVLDRFFDQTHMRSCALAELGRWREWRVSSDQ